MGDKLSNNVKSNIYNNMIKINEYISKRVGFGIVRRRKSSVFLFNPYAMRFLYFSRRYAEISHLEGNIVECGVATGRSLLMLSYLAKCDEKERKIWGFDIFEGLPDSSEEDAFANTKRLSAATENDVLKMFSFSDIGQYFIDDNVRLVKGLVQDTLIQYGNEPIALLHLGVLPGS